jgi:hypothetical protein
MVSRKRRARLTAYPRSKNSVAGIVEFYLFTIFLDPGFWEQVCGESGKIQQPREKS